MNKFIEPILKLDVISFKENVVNNVRDEDFNLVSKLILTSIRKYAMKLIISSDRVSILNIAMQLMKDLSEFRKAAVQFNPELDAEINSLLYSLLSLNFKNGIKDFKFDDDIGLDIYNAFSFCGFSLDFRGFIVEHIKNECSKLIDSYEDNYEEVVLSKALEKLKTMIKNYQTKFPDIISEKKKLKISIFKKVIDLRSNKIFDIVVSFPESKPALIDLKKCCSRISAHQEISERTIKTFISRLLHLGASTSDIIIQYINGIQALNIIDESGGLTRSVSPPIQEYLITRKDLLSTIIKMIIEDKTLVASDIITQKPNDDDIIREADVQKELDFAWNPEPLHSHIKDSESLIHDASDSDALALLLNVYGSINSFIVQLEKEIARRIQNSSGFSFEKEVSAIELLKKRFGSQSFIKCEVILKDVADSKRFTQMFECNTIQPLVISHMYWPPLVNDYLKLPNEIEEEIEKYTEKFERSKDPRKLKWHNSIGAVEIELEFNNNESLKITVPPVHASIALLMNENETITIEYVMKTLEIYRQSAETALNFWVSNNIFIKEGNKYRMSDTKPFVFNMYEEDYTVKKNENIEEEEEEEDLEPYIKDGIQFVRFVVNILQNRYKDIITLRTLYNLMHKFIQFPKFDRKYEQFIKIINFYITKNLLSIEGDGGIENDQSIVHLIDEKIADKIQNIDS